MRHQKHRSQLGVKKEHRQALLANLAAALFTHGRIETTVTKAKALRPFAERIITMAKEAHSAEKPRANYLRRLAIARVRNPDAIDMLFSKRAVQFVDRPGGFTRIHKLGARLGDATEMAQISMIDAGDTGFKARSRRDTETAPAAEESEKSD